MTVNGPVVLAILDGWGVAPPSRGNAITLAKTPVINAWTSRYPHTTLQASGVAVGLPPDQDGNSEAGHMNIGAGRIVLQDSVRVSEHINNGTFFRNPAFLMAIRHAQQNHGSLHLMGMIGNNQSAHADPDHLIALLMLAQNQRLQKVRLHLFTDGRDSPRYYAREIITKLLPHLGDAQIATLMGRFYAMDRNKNWSRTEQAYRAITEGHGRHTVNDPMVALSQAYNRGESDEFITPTVIDPYHGLDEGDAIIFFNLRSDRARQITKTFAQPNFENMNKQTKSFQRRRIYHNVMFVAMTDFGPDLPNLITAYPATTLRQTLPMALQGLKQLYIAESEKYAHVTYFFNGGYADPVAGENRIMIPSPAEKFYDRIPGMSNEKLTAGVIRAIQGGYQFITVNFANTDMVAHTGNLAAAIKAIEITDQCLGQIDQLVQLAHGALLVTADHGNLEELVNLKTGEIDTEHSTNPVPFYLIANDLSQAKLRPDGVLGDIAPTILSLLNRPIPELMIGKSLLIK